MATATKPVEHGDGTAGNKHTAILPPLLEEKPSRRWRSIVDEAKKLAAKRSRKASLLADAARQFNDLARPSQTDIALFKELFYQLIGGCEAAQRRQLSSILARNSYLPRQIAVFLAIDEYDIAAPVLLFSKVLNEADLTLLARRLPAKHRAVVCRRDTLTPAAVRALVKHGGRQCSLQLEKNRAVLNDPDLFQALSGKGPVSFNETVSQAFATERIEREIVKIAGSSVEIPLPAERKPGQAVRDELVALAGAGGRLGSKQNLQAAATPAELPRRPAPLHRRLLGPARKRDLEAIASVVASHCGLPADTTRGLLAHGGTDNVIVLFKGLGIDLQHAMQLMLLMDGEAISKGAAYDRVRTAYRNIGADECRRFLKSLGARLESRKPAASMQEDTPRPSLALIAERRRQGLSALSAPAPLPAVRTGLPEEPAIPYSRSA